MSAKRKRTSIIWLIELNVFKDIIINSFGYTDALKKFGLNNKGSNFKTLRKRMIEEGIDYSHFQQAGGNLKQFHIAKPIKELLIEDSSHNRTHLKKRLLSLGILKNICYKCGVPPIWCGEKLSIQLDHINGISNDNRLENLQMLCPNCHSQTSNYAGKSLRKNRIKKCDCGKTISLISAQCKKCKGISNSGIEKLDRRKVIRPSKEVLEKLVWEKSSCQLAKDFGVSETAIRKWRKAYGITNHPSIGYWQKQQ